MTSDLLRVPEAARQLQIDGAELYHLIARGEIFAGKGEDGLVYVPQRALDEYRNRAAASG